MQRRLLGLSFLVLMSAPLAAWAQPATEVFNENEGAVVEAQAPQGESVQAPSGAKTRAYQATQIGGAPKQVQGYYSESLRAYFYLSWWRRGNSVFPGAKLIGNPDFDSPLNQIGLRHNDIITRLDGLRVNWYGELERHYDETSVRYLRNSTGTVRQGTIRIEANDLEP